MEKGGGGGFDKKPPLLFLIGDPKQAIYSFRGADIFAYLQAVRDADSHYTLLTNWRSQPDLLRALNALFKGTDKPFLFEEIDFRDAKPAKADTPGHPDLPGAPLQVWRISRDMANTAPDKAIAKAWADVHLPLLVTGEIVRLLNEAQQPPPFEKGGAGGICKSPPAPLFQRGGLHAGDIAILVRSNRQAHLMQAALRERHVPAVLYSRESLFAGHEAREMAQLLAAVIEPARPRPLRAALCTDMLGWDGNQLHALEEDEIRWEQVLERFRGYHAAWLGRGFMPMFRELLIREGVLPRLAAYVDGERRLTNVLHLGEVLQQAWATQEHAPPRLYRWLQMRMARHSEELDEYQLRLESDARAVKLVTIHKSKGLEYPVVFVPFAWDSRFHALKATEFTFHDSEQDGRLTLDIGSPDQDAHRAPALQEELAESLRLLYVAVTRAKYRCYLVSGGFNSGIPKEFQSQVMPATGWLWHRQQDPGGLEDSVLQQDWARVAGSAKSAIGIYPPAFYYQAYRQPQSQAAELGARTFSGNLSAPWRVASFSALTARGHEISYTVRQAEQPDKDANLPGFQNPAGLREPRVPYTSIHDFPAGARAGEFFHQLLENIDFRQADHQHQVERYLKRFGFEAEWQDTVCQALYEVLHTPLSPGDFCLADIETGARLNELEFYFPLEDFDAATLNRQLTPAYGDVSPELDFDTVRGFMKGYIDMVFQWQGKFYLVDYKSNRLGDSAAAYHPAALDAEMCRHHYVLQYHIYHEALRRYLHHRQQEPALGGVFYLFLRGMPDGGVFYAHPLIDEELRITNHE